MKSPRLYSYGIVAALLLALTLLDGLIILASPILSPFFILHSPFSIPHWPAFIPTIGIQLRMEYRQIIAVGVIGLLLLVLIGYFVRRRLKNWLASRQERRAVRPDALTMAYRHKLMAQLSQLKVMDVANPLDLETSYVPLRVLFEGNEAAPPPLVGGEIMSPQEALIRFRRLALLGEPGAGKTTLLRHLAFQAAQGKLEDLPDFPIFISLSHFAAAAPQASLLDLIIWEIDALVGGHSRDRSEPFGFAQDRPAEGLRSYLEERLEEGSVLLLLDGLDEISVSLPHSSSLRLCSGQASILNSSSATYRHVVGQINVLTARYPKIPVVVTSRRAGWKGLLAASFHILKVLKLEQENIQRFIEDWFGRGSDRALELRRTVLQNSQVRALAANPLFLSLIALVFERDGALPDRRRALRGRLYGRGMELLLEKWETHPGQKAGKRVSRLSTRRRGEPVEPSGHSFTAEHQRDLLEEVALFFHPRRLLCFPEDDLRGIIASYLSAVGLPAYGVPTALERISAQYGLLRERREHPQMRGWYSFPHLTWQEYFAAAAISKSGTVAPQGAQLELALEGIPDPWWEGTTLFLSEMLEDATPLLEGILNQEDDIFRSNLLLAGRCLARKPCIKQDGLWESIIEQLQDLVEGKVHLPLRQRAIGVLAEIGDPSIAAYFLSLVTAPPLSSPLHVSGYQTVHRWVTTALASLGGESTVTNLMALLSDQGADLTVRTNIAAALGSLGDQSVVPQFLALLSDEEVDYRVRMAVAEALGAYPERSRRDESITSQLLHLLCNEKVNYNVRMTVSEVLGSLGACPEPCPEQGRRGSRRDKSIASRLLAILAKKEIDPDVRASIAAALGPLGDKSVIPQLMRLLSNEKIDPSIRWRIVDALGELGAMDDEATVPDLLGLLADEKMDSSVRVTVAEAMGEKTVTPPLPTPIPVGREAAKALRSLGDRSKVPQLLALLPDRALDRSMRLKIVEALGALGDDRFTAEGLAALLDDEEIGSDVYQALFLVSQRIGMRVFAREGGGYEVR